MKRILRALAIVAAFGLASSLFAASGSVTVGSGETLYVSLSGSTDGELILINSNNQQIVASLIYLFGGDVMVNELATGVTFTGNYGSSSLSGLPAGDYELVCRPPGSQEGWYDVTALFYGDGAEVDSFSYPLELHWLVAIY